MNGTEELARIFSAEGLFSVLQGKGGGGYHARVWMPLIGLYSGARLNEIGELTLSHIILDPIPHFRIKHAKNQSSIRDIPIHPKLIELGFLDYVEALRKSGHTRLWPFLRTQGKVNADSEVLGKWFGRYIHSKLGLPDTVVFHALRHTFKDLCRNALIPRDLHHALTGHASPGQVANVGDDYGDGYSLEVKLAQMAKIQLPFAIPRPLPFTGRTVKKQAAAGHTRVYPEGSQAAGCDLDSPTPCS